ncbi:MAG: YeeE/YedE family protein [Bacteroidetes bacterium]|nr:YeeE/YedE family protein [Bacteroidota bacterium]
MKEKYSWLLGGVLLGVVFLSAVWLIKPIGVSTQFVIVDGMVWNLFSSDLITEDVATESFSSTNAYLNKSGGKYASNIKSPLNYGILFVLSMFLGGYISGRFSKNKVLGSDKFYPEVWLNKFGTSRRKRYLFVFFAGFLVLFGARLAGGCTSGHMMSGMMQTSLSGYLFAAGTFATAIPVSILLFKSKKQ